jgi:prepilin-type N-terminal cleavage/methylation domain-containing protein/prepilin-type processing-associated H-X9-DG protein
MKTTNEAVVGATKKARAFTFVELSVVIAVVALLAVMCLLPVIAGVKCQVQNTKCLSNMHQLITAALMYADDSRGLWFYNQPAGENQEDWVTVKMDWGGTLYNGGAECTNWQSLVTSLGPGTGVATPGSYFTPYIGNPLIYKCPSDSSMALAPDAGPRVRSYSANHAVGTIWSVANIPSLNNTWADGPVTGQWLGGSDNDDQTYGCCYQKTSDMLHPSPANLWIFAEEHPDSINDGEFAVQIAEYNLGGNYIDFPANLHNGSGGFSFADGHAEMRHWLGPLLANAPFINGGGIIQAFPNGGSVTTQKDLSDLNWLQARTSYPRIPAISFPQPH